MQASVVPTVGVDIREMRIGNVHAAGARRCRRWRLLLRVFQRGHCRLLQTGQFKTQKKIIKIFFLFKFYFLKFFSEFNLMKLDFKWLSNELSNE